MDDGRRRRLLDWALVLAVGVGVAVAFDLLGVPSAALFGGLVAGLGRALLGRTRLALPRHAGTGAQAVIGVSIGALIQTDTLRTIGEHWLSVLLVTVATLGVSLVAGQLMRLQRGISPVTGAFSMIAGGASGITAMARDLGADEQVVAVLQYLRVLLIVVAMPIVATTVYGASAGSGPAPAEDGPGWPAGLLFTVVCVVVGVALGRVSRIPVGALLGPMAVAAVLDLTGLSQGATLPGLLEAAGFLAIGLQVGLGFTRASLRLVGRALPLALLLIVSAVVACAGLGAVLARTAGVSPLDGYLATTPGGLYAVLATARGSGADATFVLAVQVLRLFVMLFSAPLLARLLRPRAS
ncbi:AbrB family transcriptional regulator [Modestobacter sp. VKM Ac-2986]|uniref:AbrB family transcriptional regulator n=1 Tax=Modestobacter sp. VKM Ac-2986 TaxID=3004140 RepID=UPI0022AB649E|nr:AbrB family transcriptional regulator [Modestobacter sp. VKM Ac-2986]MCZ2829985.1 AbrB family transcriptional regulator [Modestobacter sp. VKM Ac-2986]